MFAGKMKLQNFMLIGGLVLIGGGVAAYSLWPAAAPSPATPPQPAAQRTQPTQPQSTAPQTETPTAATTPPVPQPAGRAVDREVMAYLGKSISGDKIKDATKGRPYKVNLYQDAGNATVNRAKIDLDRDEKFDEKWTFDGPNISRKVAPADDENYTETYVWGGSDWVRQ